MTAGGRTVKYRADVIGPGVINDRLAGHGTINPCADVNEQWPKPNAQKKPCARSIFE